MPCQDICVTGADLVSLFNDENVFTYDHFDKLRKTNVYRCINCPDFSVYLYGSVTTVKWLLSHEYDPDRLCSHIFGEYDCGVTSGGSTCDWLGNNYDYDVANGTYIFNIDDCLQGHNGLWYTSIAFDPDWDMVATKCHPGVVENCAKLQSSSDMYQTYSIKEGYQNLAIGFDANIAPTNVADVFTVQYSCDETNDIYHTLTNLSSNSIIMPIMNFVYNLPSDSCDKSSSVSIKFMVDGKNHVFIDNIYLYYHFENEIYLDDMGDDSNWFASSDTVTAKYNSSYLLHLSSSDNNDYASISKTIIFSKA
eukprot:242220_1